MNVLVTGADGLLGNNLVRELLFQGYQVRVLLLPKSTARALDDLQVTKFYADISGNSDELDEATKNCAAVFHCAAITDLNASHELIQKVNVEGTRNIIHSCLVNNVKRLVFVGSASSFQYGDLTRPGNEQGPFSKEYIGNIYMESKYQAMNLVQEYIKSKNLDAVIVAPTFMLGDYDTRPSSGELLLQHLTRKLRFTAPGGRNFVHVRDVAKGMILAFEKGQTSEVYILGGHNLTYAQFFSKLNTIAGVNKKVKSLPKSLLHISGGILSFIGKISRKKFPFNYKLAKISTVSAFYDPKKAIKELGMPQTPVEDAIKDSLNSLKKYGYIKEVER